MTGDEKRRPEGRRSKGHAGQADRSEDTTDDRQPAVLRVLDGGPFWVVAWTFESGAGLEAHRHKVAYIVVFEDLTGWGFVFTDDGTTGALQDVLHAWQLRVVAEGTFGVCDCGDPQISTTDPSWCVDCGGVVQ